MADRRGDKPWPHRGATSRNGRVAERREQLEKLLPQDVEAEAGVLGAVLIDAGTMARVADLLRPDHFYREAHRKIFQSMLDLWEAGTPPDYIMLCDEMDRRGELDEVGGRHYIGSLSNQVPTSRNAEHYAQIVRRCYHLRELIHAAGQIAGVAYNQPDADVAEEQAQRLMDAISDDMHGGSRTRDDDSLAGVLSLTFTEIDRWYDNPHGLRGASLGLHKLEKFLPGLQRKRLYVIAAPPSQGKTTLALTMARGAAKYPAWQGHKPRVGFVSLEMSKEQLGLRLVAMESGQDAEMIQAGDREAVDWSEVHAARYELELLPLRIEDGAAMADEGLTMSAIRRIGRRWGDLDVLFIDYLGLVAPDEDDARKNKDQQIGNIALLAKRLAVRLNTAVVLLSQMSRASDGRAGKMPQLSDLRYSGDIEAHADCVLFIFDPNYYKQRGQQTGSEILDKWADEEPGKTLIIIAKNRNGRVGKTVVFFDYARNTFYDYSFDHQRGFGTPTDYEGRIHIPTRSDIRATTAVEGLD